MTGKCICEICTCGRHRCPHVPTNLLGKGPCQLNDTEYTNVYKPHHIPQRVSFKPNPEPVKGGAFEDRTTQRADFVPYQVQKPYVHQAEQYQAPEGEVEKVTSYKQEYTEKHAPPAKAIRNEGQRMLPAKFEGEPTYRADYKKWEGGRQPTYASQAQWQPPTAQMEDQTTSKHDYKRYENQVRQSCKPLEGAKLSDAPLEDRTTHRDAYIQHAVQPKFQREREQYKPSGAPMDGVTTFRRDYQGVPGSRIQSFKPLNQAFSSEAPLEDETTNRHDYQKWPASRPYQHLPEPYHKPEGEMPMDTTHKATYKEMPLVRVQAQRPVSANRSKNVPFDGTTNYSQDFRKWQADRVTVPKRAEYVPNQAPFEGNSTYKQQYKPLPVDPAKSCRPGNQAFQSDSRFQDDTMYKSDYTRKEIAICEAAIIDQGRSRYKFQEMDSRGHRLYAPVRTTITPINGTRVPSQSQQRLAMSVA